MEMSGSASTMIYNCNTYTTLKEELLKTEN